MLTENDKSYIWLGIDPGISGAIAAINAGGEYIGVWDMPTSVTGKKQSVSPGQLTHIIRDLTVEYTIRRCTIESVHAMPKQGVSSSFNFGKSYGLAIGVVSGLSIPMIYVTPSSWKGAYKLRGKHKDESRTFAQSMFPGCDCLKRKKDVDRAEALLIAKYGYDLRL